MGSAVRDSFDWERSIGECNKTGRIVLIQKITSSEDILGCFTCATKVMDWLLVRNG